MAISGEIVARLPHQGGVGLRGDVAPHAFEGRFTPGLQGQVQVPAQARFFPQSEEKTPPGSQGSKEESRRRGVSVSFKILPTSQGRLEGGSRSRPQAPSCTPVSTISWVPPARAEWISCSTAWPGGRTVDLPRSRRSQAEGAVVIAALLDFDKPRAVRWWAPGSSWRASGSRSKVLLGQMQGFRNQAVLARVGDHFVTAGILKAASGSRVAQQPVTTISGGACFGGLADFLT